MAEPVTVAIVPHTHWDREWYSPFQAFRIRLVRLLDELLPLLESDLSYAHFLLDGQTAVLDDYLEIRPEAAPVLTRLATSGRVAVGPWMILMDEYMVSGETIVRDLQMGLARATELGGAMQVGYLPDMFGHVAQMPQLLRLAGLDHAVVWRGVPAAVTQTAFWWEAPDGSRVRAEYLYGSYSNGRDLPDDAKQLVARARGYEAELGAARLPGGGLLLMNGTDHQMPQPWLGRVVAEANALQDDYRFVVTALADHVAAQPTSGLTTWRGEMRSGARANVLMGVASNRVDVHRRCAVAERMLERQAEPLAALYAPEGRYPHALLDVAWRNLVLNSAHDSSCACSHDDVVDAVTVRYQEAEHVAHGLTREALHHLARTVDAPAASTVVVSSTARDRDGLVELRVHGSGPVHLETLDDGTPLAAQVLRDEGGEAFAIVAAGGQLHSVLEMMRGPEFAGMRVARSTIERGPDGAVLVECTGAARGETATDLDPLKDQLLTVLDGDPDTVFRFRVLRAPARTVVAVVPDVPGFGWRCVRAVDGPAPAAARTAVEAGDHRIANEHLQVDVDPGTGTYAITSGGIVLAGLGRLVDGGDGGDTYNYSPPAQDRVVDTPDSVSVTVVERGPVRAALRIDAEYGWPERALGDERSCSARSDTTVAGRVSTVLSVVAGEPMLRVETTVDNRSRDHRLRAHFPLPAPVSSSHAECAFAVVERGLTAEGGPSEHPLATFVSRRFVDASDGAVGLALLHEGLLEYEVVDDGRELALTLLRATGYLSRSELALRPNPAGPLDPLEGPQLQRPLTLRYAVLPHRGDWRTADLHARADEFSVPLERVRGGGAAGASRPVTGRPLAVEGAVVSALHREPGGLVLRVFNPQPDATEVTIRRDGAPATGWLVDLVGRPLERWTSSFSLRPSGIATARLD
jgi:alpha-mannosidase